MALSRCGDGLSVDSAITSRRLKKRPVRAAVSSGEYTWPIRMVWLVMAVIFFAAGVSKLRYSGLRWASAPAMATMLTVGYYHIANGDPLTAWGPFLAHSVWLCRLLAGSAIPLACMPSKSKYHGCGLGRSL